jgi:hypothetical protein
VRVQSFRFKGSNGSLMHTLLRSRKQQTPQEAEPGRRKVFVCAISSASRATGRKGLSMPYIAEIKKLSTPHEAKPGRRKVFFCMCLSIRITSQGEMDCQCILHTSTRSKKHQAPHKAEPKSWQERELPFYVLRHPHQGEKELMHPITA